MLVFFLEKPPMHPKLYNDTQHYSHQPHTLYHKTHRKYINHKNTTLNNYQEPQHNKHHPRKTNSNRKHKQQTTNKKWQYPPTTLPTLPIRHANQTGHQ